MYTSKTTIPLIAFSDSESGAMDCVGLEAFRFELVCDDTGMEHSESTETLNDKMREIDSDFSWKCTGEAEGVG